MSITIESDLKEVLSKFDQKLDKLEQKLDYLSKDVTDIKVSVAQLEEKVEGLSKRVDSQKFFSTGILIGLIVTILGGAAKLFGFIGNP